MAHDSLEILYSTFYQVAAEVYVKCLIVSNHLVGWGLSIEIDIVSKVYQRLFDEYNKLGRLGIGSMLHARVQ